MPLTIRPDSLLSRGISYFSSQGKSGKDLLNSYKGGTVPAKKLSLNKLAQLQQDTGLLDHVWNMGKSAINFVFGTIDFLAWSAVSIFSWVVSGIESLKAFNWNASDEDLKKSIEGHNPSVSDNWRS